MRLRLAGVSAAVLSVATVVVGVGVGTSPAGAAVGCGTVLTTDTTLATDVGPCPGNGLVIGADGITVNLGGHRVFGSEAPGDGAGIYLWSRRNVTVTNGTVSGFDGGVVIRYGSGNTVTSITAQNNVGLNPGSPSTLYGDGIAIEASSSNRIIGNKTINNAPFSGIGIYQQSDSDHAGFTTGPAVNNLIQGNLVQGNTGCRFQSTCDNDGIRVEPNVSPGNLIVGNTVDHSGLDGISLFGGVSGTTVAYNVVTNSGVTNSLGDGIRVFGFGNAIQANKTNANASGGISVGRRTGLGSTGFPNANGKNNKLLGNSASGNLVYDLWDSNPGCATNTWTGNTGGTTNQACTRAP